MILTGPAIRQRMDAGDIVIDPFDEKQLNPNSYNLRLHNELLIYRKGIGAGVLETLDMRANNPTTRAKIPLDGFRLIPGILYLGRTVERTETRNLIPQLQGRSSTGRLGLSVHVTAGLGDIGFRGFWTLELTVTHPLKIYPGVEVCQIIYHVPETGGLPMPEYAGRYQDAKDVEPSKMHLARAESGRTFQDRSV
jgi:dCTP deaminase